VDTNHKQKEDMSQDITIEDIASRWAMCYECTQEQVIAAVMRSANYRKCSVETPKEFSDACDYLFVHD